MLSKQPTTEGINEQPSAESISNDLSRRVVMTLPRLRLVGGEELNSDGVSLHQTANSRSAGVCRIIERTEYVLKEEYVLTKTRLHLAAWSNAECICKYAT